LIEPRIAFYDFDGTIIRGNIVQRYMYFATRHGPAIDAVRRIARLAGLAPRLYAAEHRSRAAFNVLLFREYRALRTERLRQLEPALRGSMRRNIYPKALRQLRFDRAAGLRLVLITGELALAVGPLADELGFDELVANTLEVASHQATGAIVAPLIAEGNKAHAAEAACRRVGCKLAEAKAYADSWFDLSLLELVGWPTAVNADHRLRTRAEQRGWPVVDWRSLD
jgi:phosphoserine phosphatase